MPSMVTGGGGSPVPAKAGAAAAVATTGTAHTPVRTTARLLGFFITGSPLVPCVPGGVVHGTPDTAYGPTAGRTTPRGEHPHELPPSRPPAPSPATPPAPPSRYVTTTSVSAVRRERNTRLRKIVPNPRQPGSDRRTPLPGTPLSWGRIRRRSAGIVTSMPGRSR